MRRPPARAGRRRHTGWALVAAMAMTAGSVATVPASAATPAKINGQGSSYVALAMAQWVASAQVNGLSVNYLPTGSPAGLESFRSNLVDFAGTEAEFSALGGPNGGDPPPRGFQYVPDVAGAVAVMYNLVDKAGRKIDYLRLSRRTVARIFMGDISRWSDPAIAADNANLVDLPDEPIEVIYRSGSSGTTALFYDFVASIAPDVFGPWAARNQFPTTRRIITLDGSQDFAPKAQGLGGSDQIAQYVASTRGKFSIAYDEFGFAKVYRATVARVENASGNWVLPFAQNISAALESAGLRADLSQELSGVYTSTNPEAYPISAYSYMVTQCAQAGDRPTCRGPYDNAGISETFSQWMRYIACEGQVEMARIGYSPLPPNLSQEMVNSIARLEGTQPEQLDAGNCSNPRFSGTLGEGAVSPPDRLEQEIAAQAGGGGTTPTGETGAAGPTGSVTPGGGPTVGDGQGGEQSANPSVSGGGLAGGTRAQSALTRTAGIVGGGSASWRAAAPVAYDRPTGGDSGAWALMLLLALLAVPPVVAAIRRIPPRPARPPAAAGRPR